MWLLILAICIVVLICIVVFCIYGINKFEEWCHEENRKQWQKEKMEKEKKQKSAEELLKKRKKMYADYLPNIYMNLTKEQLKRAHTLLRQMYYNDYDVGDPNYSKSTVEAWYDARSELIKLLGNPKWNDGNNWSDSPLWPNIDMNYIHSLLSR